MLYTNEMTSVGDLAKCIQNCTDCYDICVQTTDYCIRMGGKHVEAGRLNSLMDCAETCRASANFMLRGSSLLSQAWSVCIEECEHCAELCAELEGDAQIWACIEECLRCIDSCREMAGLKIYVPVSQSAMAMYS